jgi:hypothetical protein
MCALHIPLPYTKKNQSFHLPESLHYKTTVISTEKNESTVQQSGICRLYIYTQITICRNETTMRLVFYQNSGSDHS